MITGKGSRRARSPSVAPDCGCCLWSHGLLYKDQWLSSTPCLDTNAHRPTPSLLILQAEGTSVLIKNPGGYDREVSVPGFWFSSLVVTRLQNVSSCLHGFCCCSVSGFHFQSLCGTGTGGSGCRATENA